MAFGLSLNFPCRRRIPKRRTLRAVIAQSGLTVAEFLALL
jgi:hypothetical protein